MSPDIKANGRKIQEGRRGFIRLSMGGYDLGDSRGLPRVGEDGYDGGNEDRNRKKGRILYGGEAGAGDGIRSRPPGGEEKNPHLWSPDP